MSKTIMVEKSSDRAHLRLGRYVVAGLLVLSSTSLAQTASESAKFECGKTYSAGEVSIMILPATETDVSKNCSQFMVAVETKNLDANYAVIETFYWATGVIGLSPATKLMRCKTIPVAILSAGIMNLADSPGVPLEKVEKINVRLMKSGDTVEFWNYAKGETPETRKGRPAK